MPPGQMLRSMGLNFAGAAFIAGAAGSVLLYDHLHDQILRRTV
jgi:hypothetical protein